MGIENLHMLRALMFVYNIELRTGPWIWKDERITFYSAQTRKLVIVLSCTRDMTHHLWYRLLVLREDFQKNDLD